MAIEYRWSSTFACSASQTRETMPDRRPGVIRREKRAKWALSSASRISWHPVRSGTHEHRSPVVVDGPQIPVVRHQTGLGEDTAVASTEDAGLQIVEVKDDVVEAVGVEIPHRQRSVPETSDRRAPEEPASGSLQRAGPVTRRAAGSDRHDDILRSAVAKVSRVDADRQSRVGREQVDPDRMPGGVAQREHRPSRSISANRDAVGSTGVRNEEELLSDAVVLENLRRWRRRRGGVRDSGEPKDAVSGIEHDHVVLPRRSEPSDGDDLGRVSVPGRTSRIASDGHPGHAPKRLVQEIDASVLSGYDDSSVAPRPATQSEQAHADPSSRRKAGADLSGLERDEAELIAVRIARDSTKNQELRRSSIEDERRRPRVVLRWIIGGTRDRGRQPNIARDEAGLSEPSPFVSDPDRLVPESGSLGSNSGRPEKAGEPFRSVRYP